MFAAEFQEDPDKAIDLLLAILEPHLAKPGKISSVEAQQLLLRAYQVWCGFTNEATLTQRPASLVAFHTAEDVYKGSLREDHMEHFVELKIGDLFNVSFDQYLARPRHEVKMMREVAERYQKKKNTVEQNALEEARKLLASQQGAGKL